MFKGFIGRMRGLGLVLGLGLCVGLAPAVAMAQTDQAAFDLVIKGIRAGTLNFTGTQDGGRYSVAGKLQSGGLVAMLRKVRYDAKATGSVVRGRYVPASYTEIADTGKRRSEAVMAYRAGVPQVKTYNPPRDPRPGDVSPATQGGTVDPLTALYATLRDVDAGQECKVDLQLFDGRRRTQVRLNSPQAQGEAVVCNGEYRRLQGFSAEDMAEKSRFAFRVTFQPLGNGRMRATEVAMDTLYGKASLKRR
ncbi:DUF3108 domain-containing protein [Paracoccaceae bacterium Fryx2]|nr:DUF3108 domain-containing protein [Paracoccaceae bacterium Fryx2]